jgi:hypothetical protein
MEAEPFAAGQFGTVTRATWRGMRVVCKRSKESMGETPGVSREAAELEALRALVDWGNELDLLTTLRHPNLVMFLGACISENVRGRGSARESALMSSRLSRLREGYY